MLRPRMTFRRKDRREERDIRARRRRASEIGGVVTGRADDDSGVAL